jgi:hypothetical protein
MSDTAHDAEVKAIETMLSVLVGLDPAACNRVLAYVFARLNINRPLPVNDELISFRRWELVRGQSQELENHFQENKKDSTKEPNALRQCLG